MITLGNPVMSAGTIRLQQRNQKSGRVNSSKRIMAIDDKKDQYAKNVEKHKRDSLANFTRRSVFTGLGLGSLLGFLSPVPQQDDPCQGKINLTQTEKEFKEFFKAITPFTGPVTEKQKKETREAVVKAQKEAKPVCLPFEAYPPISATAGALATAQSVAKVVNAFNTELANIVPLTVAGEILGVGLAAGAGMVVVGYTATKELTRMIFIPPNSKPEDVAKLLR